jgi:ribosome-binding protein aMBF1 (putative translation factor)
MAKNDALRDSREEIDFDQILRNTRFRKKFDSASAALEAAALVREMRKKADDGKGISQSELGRRLGVSCSRISVIESGDGPTGPTYALLKRIAKACRISLTIHLAPIQD